MPAAGVVLLVTVVLIVLALVYYLVSTILALREITSGLDDVIAGVGEILEKSAPVNAQPVYVTIPADFSRTHTVQLDKDSVRIDFLQERIRQALLARDDKSVFIRADGGATVQDVANVWDKLKEAGVEKVGLMTQPGGR